MTGAAHGLEHFLIFLATGMAHFDSAIHGGGGRLNRPTSARTAMPPDLGRYLLSAS
jgi:hypothetical protein